MCSSIACGARHRSDSAPFARGPPHNPLVHIMSVYVQRKNAIQEARHVVFIHLPSGAFSRGWTVPDT
jgi:hypothetical protein